MRFITLFFLTLLTFFLTLDSADARQKSYIKKSNPKRIKSHIVIDAYTGRILFGKNMNERLYPASMTKMMTILLAFEHIENRKLKWHDRVRISKNAAKKEPSNLYIKIGEYITVREAILSLITKSANNVAVALAEKMAGSEKKFAKLMNIKARELNMVSSAFYNPSGLPNKHQKTTAYDMAKLAQALILHYGKYYNLFSTRFFKHRGTRYNNHNKLLGKFFGLDGLKTGYTRAAGFNLAASAKRGHNRLIVIVMGESSSTLRNKKVATLLIKGFKKIGYYLTHKGPLKKRPPRVHEYLLSLNR